MKRRIVNVLSVMIVAVIVLIAFTVREAGRQEPMKPVYHGVHSHHVADKEVPPGEFKIGPVNDAFLNFSEYSEDAKNRYKKKKNRKDRILGLIPSPIPPDIHKKNKHAESKSDNLPTRYDLRDPDGNGDLTDGLLTPAKDQGDCSAAWAFALYGSLEGVLKSREGMSDVFSENHMIFSTGYDWGECGGGNLDMSMAYLSRNKGPVRQASDPLVIGSEHYCTSCAPIHYIDSVFRLPVRSSVSDVAYIKKAILEFGPLYASMNWIESEYHAKSHTYCCVTPGSNHAVALVGWDDQKTVRGTSKKGAFIAKNSWGTDFGENGFFYISYDDKGLAFHVLGAFRDEPDSLLVFDRILYHDFLGMTASTGFGSNVAWGASFFPADNGGKLMAVSFFTTAYETNYEIVIYDGMEQNRLVNPKSPAVTGSLAGKGYHTVKLPNPITLIEGHGFIVAVKFETPDNLWPIPIERPFPDYSSAADANPGDSYLSSDGVNWVDTITVFPQTSVCIKALLLEKGCDENVLKVDALSQSGDFLVNGMNGRRIAAVVTDGCGQPVRGADVEAEFTNGKPDVPLYDDGLHHDGAKDDGIYADIIPWKGDIKGSDMVIYARKNGFEIIASKKKEEKKESEEKGCFIGSLL